VFLPLAGLLLALTAGVLGLFPPAGVRSRGVVLLALLAWPPGTGAGPAGEGARPEEARKEFQRICQQFRSGRNAFYGVAQVEELKTQLAQSSGAAKNEAGLKAQLAHEYLRLGRPEESVRLFREARQIAVSRNLSEQMRLQLTRDLALAHLRVGEQSNCVNTHTPASCLLPIGEAGVHRDKSGSLAAMRAFQEYLSERPEDTAARWLFNIAAMTAGRYPEGVPEAYRVDPKALTSSYDIKRFPDIASAAGLEIMDSSGAAMVDDFDGDGLLDVVTTTINPCGAMRFFRSDGRGGFEERTAKAGLDVQLGGLNAVHADYDNDGDFDILVLRGGWFGSDGRIRRSLLRNDGGVFTDVTHAASLAKPYPSQTADWADYDSDGDLDLYVGNEVDDSDIAYPSQLFRNNGNGTFTDVSEKAGVENFRMAKGVAWGDYDNDGDPDLYVSNIGINRLYRNNGDGTFTDVAPEAGVVEPVGRSFATWFFDYDNDGWEDIFVADYGAPVSDVVGVYFGKSAEGGHPRLYRNLGNGRFEDASREAGLTAPSLPMGANYGDLDNDGWLDFYLGTGLPGYEALTPNLMYRNDGGKRFQDVSFSGGFAHLQKGHGVAWADLDNDGDQDIFEQMGGAYPGDSYMSVLYENPGHGNSWVTLRLSGVKSNRNAIGARIEVAVATNDGPRTIHRTVGASGSFGGSSYQQEIGLGRAKRIEKIEVFWPSSKTKQVFRGVAPNASYEVREGVRALKRLSPSRIQLGRPKRSIDLVHD